MVKTLAGLVMAVAISDQSIEFASDQFLSQSEMESNIWETFLDTHRSGLKYERTPDAKKEMGPMKALATHRLTYYQKLADKHGDYDPIIRMALELAAATATGVCPDVNAIHDTRRNLEGEIFAKTRGSLDSDWKIPNSKDGFFTKEEKNKWPIKEPNLPAFHRLTDRCRYQMDFQGHPRSRTKPKFVRQLSRIFGLFQFQSIFAAGETLSWLTLVADYCEKKEIAPSFEDSARVQFHIRQYVGLIAADSHITTAETRVQACNFGSMLNSLSLEAKKSPSHGKEILFMVKYYILQKYVNDDEFFRSTLSTSSSALPGINYYKPLRVTFMSISGVNTDSVFSFPATKPTLNLLGTPVSDSQLPDMGDSFDVGYGRRHLTIAIESLENWVCRGKEVALVNGRCVAVLAGYTSEAFTNTVVKCDANSTPKEGYYIWPGCERRNAASVYLKEFLGPTFTIDFALNLDWNYSPDTDVSHKGLVVMGEFMNWVMTVDYKEGNDWRLSLQGPIFGKLSLQSLPLPTQSGGPLRVRMVVDDEWVSLFAVKSNNSKPQTILLGNLRELRNRSECVGSSHPFKARVGFARRNDTFKLLQSPRGYFHVGSLTLPGQADYDALPKSLQISTRTQWLHTKVGILKIWKDAIYKNGPDIHALFESKAADMIVNITDPQFSEQIRLTETLDQ
jgi:hypothetical protein